MEFEQRMATAESPEMVAMINALKNDNTLSPVRKLDEIMRVHDISVVYVLVYIGDDLSQAVIDVSAFDGTLVVRGIGWTIDDAKTKAAIGLLKAIGCHCDYPNDPSSQKAEQIRKTVEQNLTSNPVETLFRFCALRRWPMPKYRYIRGELNQPNTVTCTCTVGSYTAEVVGETKRISEERAACAVFRMIVDLRSDLFPAEIEENEPVSNDATNDQRQNPVSVDECPNVSSLIIPVDQERPSDDGDSAPKTEDKVVRTTANQEDEPASNDATNDQRQNPVSVDECPFVSSLMIPVDQEKQSDDEDSAPKTEDKVIRTTENQEDQPASNGASNDQRQSPVSVEECPNISSLMITVDQERTSDDGDSAAEMEDKVVRTTDNGAYEPASNDATNDEPENLISVDDCSSISSLMILVDEKKPSDDDDSAPEVEVKSKRKTLLKRIKRFFLRIIICR